MPALANGLGIFANAQPEPLEDFDITFKYWVQNPNSPTEYDLEGYHIATYTEDDSLSIATNAKSYPYCDLEKVTYQKSGGSVTDISSTGTLVVAKDTTINYYYLRKTYYLTMASNSNMSNTFYVNNQAFKTNTALPFLYQQELTVEVTPNLGYVFGKWTTSPVISEINGSGTNGITFEMPQQSFTMSATMVKESEVYTVKVQHYFEQANGTDFEQNSSYPNSSFQVTENSTITLQDSKIERYGFSYAYGKYNNASVTSVKVTGNITIKLYYNRIRHTLTVKGDSGVASFQSNDKDYTIGSTLEYKYEQRVKLLAIFKSGYTLLEWESERLVISNKQSNPLTIESFPLEDIIVTIHSQEAPIQPWEWSSDEEKAFEGNGAFDTLTADRWNAFLDWCNEVINYKGGTTIAKTYYGTKGQPLYASSFNAITQRIGAVSSALSSDVKATKNTGDIIYGWYFIHLAAAMNALL